MSNFQLLSKVIGNAEFLNPNSIPQSPLLARRVRQVLVQLVASSLLQQISHPLVWTAKRGQQVLDRAASALLALQVDCCNFAMFDVSSTLSKSMSSTES